MDTEYALRNILALLQQEPHRYRNFGIYWWPVKRLLKTRYGTPQLYLLGDYVDPECAARVPVGSDEETLERAIEEFQHNARWNVGAADVSDTEGQPVHIFDEDAGR